MIIDKNGKIFSKINVIDLILIILVLGLGFGQFYKHANSSARTIIGATDKFYITMVIEKVREFSVDALNKKGMFYEQHGNLIGEALDVRIEQADNIMVKDDGSIVRAKVDKKYNVYVTFESRGSISDSGYYINGTRSVAPGNEITMQSSNVLARMRVISVTEQAPL